MASIPSHGPRCSLGSLISPGGPWSQTISVYFCSLGLVKKSVGVWRGVCTDGSRQQENEGARETPLLLRVVCRSGRQLLDGVSRVKSVFDGSKS